MSYWTQERGDGVLGVILDTGKGMMGPWGTYYIGYGKGVVGPWGPY